MTQHNDLVAERRDEVLKRMLNTPAEAAQAEREEGARAEARALKD